MEKMETKGRNGIISLFDAGTFVEMGAYVRRKGEMDTFDAVLCGYGAVEGRLAFAFVQDSDSKKGALDETGAVKIEKLYEQAVRVGAPVIGVFDSAGAVVCDGASALSAYGKLMKCVSDASGIIPQIALVNGVCGGMAAVATGLFDMTVTVKDTSELFVNAPVLAGKETGKTAYAAENGLCALNAATAEAAIASVRSLVALLPRNNRDSADSDASDDANRTATAGLTGSALVRDLCDSESFIELYNEYGKGLTIGLGRMGGTVTGVIASVPDADGGRVTAADACKAARLISFCDAFSVPVVTLVDSEGVDTAADPALAPALGRLATAYLTATCPKVTAVTGKAYGASFTLLGSRSLGTDFAVALDDAVISVLNPATAVAFLRNNEITSDKSRTDVEAEWAKENGAAAAAACGVIDDIVSATELRARLCAALYMLSGKADGMPDRKHPVLPL